MVHLHVRLNVAIRKRTELPFWMTQANKSTNLTENKIDENALVGKIMKIERVNIP